jgi:hypothetical protein
MTNADQPSSGIQPNRRLLVVSAALIGVGGLLGFAGAVLGSMALYTATRRWVDHLETPPREIAQQGWTRAKAATAAGADAWRHAHPSDSGSAGTGS